MTEPVVAARGLRLQRGYRTLIESLDLTLGPGEVLHVRGPNGCGKSTLLECIAGLREADSGTLERPPHWQSLWLGHRTGMAPELSALENLRIWCRLHGGEEANVAAAMQRWRVPRARLRPLGALSAGQQQRTALATLGLKPDMRLWILDEPAASLDAAAIPLLAEELQRFTAAGGAVLLSTHQDIGLETYRELQLATDVPLPR